MLHAVGVTSVAMSSAVNTLISISRKTAMPAIRRILVAIKDLRSISRPALRKAAQIATACHAQVELYHCMTTPLYMDRIYDHQKGLKTTEREMRQDALRRLERIAATLRLPGLKITAAAEWDYPAYDAIVRRALHIKADLIVASAHAGPHLLPGFLRLTDWELVRLSPVPLLLIKNPRPYHRPAVLVAVDPTHAFAKPLQLDKPQPARQPARGPRLCTPVVRCFILWRAGQHGLCHQAS